MLNKLSNSEKKEKISESTRKIFTRNKKRNLVCYTSPDSTISEQFRTIRTNLQIMMGDRRSQTILITSSNSGEGKSTTLANLAVSISQQKQKVLLIDANLRNPYIHTIFRFQNGEGLSNILMGEGKFEEVVRCTGINGLDVLPSGPVPLNPTELLGSYEMKNLLKTFSNYDIVLVDSPAILEASETRILAGLCDGVILVIQKGKTIIDKAIESKSVLEFSNSKLVGVILNEQ